MSCGCMLPQSPQGIQSGARKIIVVWASYLLQNVSMRTEDILAKQSWHTFRLKARLDREHTRTSPESMKDSSQNQLPKKRMKWVIVKSF